MAEKGFGVDLLIFLELTNPSLCDRGDEDLQSRQSDGFEESGGHHKLKQAEGVARARTQNDLERSETSVAMMGSVSGA